MTHPLITAHAEITRLREALERIQFHHALHTSNPPNEEWNASDTWFNKGLNVARDIAARALKES